MNIHDSDDVIRAARKRGDSITGERDHELALLMIQRSGNEFSEQTYCTALKMLAAGLGDDELDELAQGLVDEGYSADEYLAAVKDADGVGGLSYYDNEGA
jgi:hypothetical protein